MLGAREIHVLRYGLPLCGFSEEVPAKWPHGAKWVSLDDLKHATCSQCVIRAHQLVQGFGQDEFCHAPPVFEMVQEPDGAWLWKLSCDKCRAYWTSASRPEAISQWEHHDCKLPPSVWDRISAD